MDISSKMASNIEVMQLRELSSYMIVMLESPLYSDASIATTDMTLENRPSDSMVGKLLIRCTKYCKKNHSQIMKHPCRQSLNGHLDLNLILGRFIETSPIHHWKQSEKHPNTAQPNANPVDGDEVVAKNTKGYKSPTFP